MKLQDAELALSNPNPSLSSDPLAPYRNARGPLLDDLAALRRLVLDNPPRVARVEAIERLVEAYFERFDREAATKPTEPAMVAATATEGEAQDSLNRIR